MARAKPDSGAGSTAKIDNAVARTGEEARAGREKTRRTLESTTQDADVPARDARARARAQSPLNSIQPSRPRARSAREDGRTGHAVHAHASPTAQAPAEAKETTPTPPASSDRDAWAIPDSVRDRFIQGGRQWYFPDGAPAFRDHGRRLSTPSENTEVITSLIEIARGRGWESITVRGTERFRQEAWKQGTLAGLEVRGYRASEAERAALIRTLSRREKAARPEAFALQPPPGETAAPARARHTGKDARHRPDEPITGTLLDHGAEHYRFDPRADYSYFVRLETPEGKRTIWGTDFQRAFKESLSQPQIGDEVVIQRRGSAPVTVMRRERDREGKVLSETEVDARRHTWSIERADFIAERQRAAEALRDRGRSPQRIVHDYPQLAGTLLQVKAAELAARRFSDSRDRERFVSLVREALADEVARGEPLRPVRLKDPRAHRPAPERAQAPTR